MLSDVVRLVIVRSVLTLVIDLSRSQLLKGNRSLNRLSHIIINSDLNLNLAVGGLWLEGLLTGTQNRLAVLLANQLSLQGVFLTRNKVLIRHSVNNRGTLFYTVTILDGSFRFNLGLKTLLLLTSSRSRFRIRRYISRLIRSRLGGGVLRSGSLRLRRLRILSCLVRRSLPARIFRSRLGGGVLRSGSLRLRRLRILSCLVRRSLPARIFRSRLVRRSLLRRSRGLFGTTTIVRLIRQTGLVYRNDRLSL